jgi:hypothetical protein
MAFGDFTVDRNDKKYVLGSGGTIVEYAEDEPAFEFNADGSYKGLLVEPAATNYDTASSTVVLGWSTSNMTTSADQTTAPDGVATSADSVLETIANGNHLIFEDYTLGAGSYIFSCFVKSIGGRNFQLNTQQLGGGGSGGGTVKFNLSTGTVASGTGTITEIGDGWYRVSGPAVTAGATGIRAVAYSLDGTTDIFTGDVTKGFYMWGMQVEAGPIATSYIPTTGSQENRVKDDISLTSASSLIGQTEGTLYFEGTMRAYLTGGSNYRALLSIDGSGGTIRILREPTSDDKFFAEKIGGSGVLYISSGSVTGTFKCALAYKNNDYELYVNGVSKGFDTSAGVPSPFDEIGLGQDLTVAGSARIWNDHIRAVALYPKRLSDAECIALTTL